MQTLHLRVHRVVINSYLQKNIYLSQFSRIVKLVNFVWQLDPSGFKSHSSILPTSTSSDKEAAGMREVKVVMKVRSDCSNLHLPQVVNNDGAVKEISIVVVVETSGVFTLKE